MLSFRTSKLSTFHRWIQNTRKLTFACESGHGVNVNVATYASIRISPDSQSILDVIAQTRAMKCILHTANLKDSFIFLVPSIRLKMWEILWPALKEGSELMNLIRRKFSIFSWIMLSHLPGRFQTAPHNENNKILSKFPRKEPIKYRPIYVYQKIIRTNI